MSRAEHQQTKRPFVCRSRPGRGARFVPLMVWCCSIACSGVGTLWGAEEPTGKAAGSQKVAIDAALERGVGWLLQQQEDDGGWHSQTYRNLEGGTGVTALVTRALVETPPPWWLQSRPAVRAGVRFEMAHVNAAGLVQDPEEGAADLQLYATALLLEALSRRPELSSPDIVRRLSAGLQQAQRTERNGWSREDREYGGWGWDSPRREDRSVTSPANISITATVLKALSASQTISDETRAAALVFVERCQQRKQTGGDGGFVFTPVGPHPLNKAGWSIDPNGVTQVRPYRTATCDGVIALRALGRDRDAPQVAAGWTWLRNAYAVEGAASDPRLEAGRGGLDFYEAAVLAALLEDFADSCPNDLPSQWAERLLRSQQPDGSWRNPQPGMREDDPLIATALSVLALTRLQRVPGP